jgi:HlyD family secretion protein
VRNLRVAPETETRPAAPPATTEAPVRRRWWLPWLILAVAVAVAAALVATRPQPQPVAVPERVWLVSAETVTASSYRPSVTLYGRVASLWSSELRAGVDADVVEVAVVDGDTVAEDDVLVRLDDRDARLELAQREAELEQAEARIEAELRRHATNVESLPREERLLALTRGEVSRLRDLVQKQVGAQSQLDEARQAAERQAIALADRQQAVDEHGARLAEVEAARARAEALRDQALLAVERTVVRAPFNGRIAELMVSPGRRVKTGDALVRLFDTDAMVVRAQLPSRVLPQVRAALAEGRELTVTGYVDGQPATARLRSLAGEATGSTGGVDAIFTVLDDLAQVSQGQFVRLELTLPAADGLIALPHEAIYGTDRIYTIDADSRMRAHPVERVGQWTGPDGKAHVLVRPVDGVPTEPVVTTQLPNALDGLLVRVVDPG